MKKLYSFLCALICAMSLNAKTIYLNAGGSALWEQAGAQMAAWVWVDGSDGSWAGGTFLTTNSEGYYVVEVADNINRVQFVRCNKDASSPSFDSKWNNTNNLEIPTDGRNLYTITGWGGGDGTWTTYTPLSGGTIPKQIKGSFDDWNTHDFTESGGLYSYTYTNLTENTSYEFVVVPQSGNDFKNKNITKESPSAVLEQTGSNATIKTDVAGDYKFTWDPATNTITVTYPSSSTPYTVTFDANGHGTAPAKQSVTCGGKATEPTAPTATGYTFGGWYTEAACTNKYDFTTTVTKDITLYAKWTATVVAITSYTVVGSSGSVFGTGGCPTCTANDMTLQADGTYKLVKNVQCLTANTRDFYIVGNHDENVWRFPASGTLSYTNSTIGCYTITFTLDLSGTVSATATMLKDDPATTEFYYYDSKGSWDDAKCKGLTKTANYAYVQLTKSDYSGDNEFKIFNGNTKSTDNWYGSTDQKDEKCHTVACGSNISSTLKGNIELTSNTGDYPNAKYNVSSLATETFYIILYYPNTSENGSSDYVLAASTTLPDASTYVVSFNYNGGSGATSSLSCDKGGSITLPTPDTREGYTFNGWYTAATGGTLAGAAGASYTPAGSLTLYAQWTGSAPAQDWYVYGAGGGLSWTKTEGKKMTLHGDGYYYYECSGVSQFKIDGNPLTDDALGGTYISNSFPDAATANITLADDGSKYHNINVTNASGAFEIRLYPAGKAGNTTSNPIIIAHYDVISTGTFWYFDEKNTSWNITIGDEWKLIDAGDYAYVSVPARNSDDNKFKIFPENPKNDNNVTANGDNIATGDLAGEIKLTAEGGDWNNIKIAATTADYYVILYYPNTTTNPSAKYLVAATYDLPGVQKYAVSFGVVGNTGGSISAKSGSSTITSGQLVTRATFTATPAAGYSVEGWYSDAEGTQRIDAAGTSTTYTQAITATNNSVYVKFEKKYALYFKPNAPISWGETWAYMFTDEVWDKTGKDKGVNVSNSARSEYGKMSKLNDSVYYYNLTSSADVTYFALNNADQHTYGELFGCDAIYRGDFHKDMPVFIAQEGQSAVIKNDNGSGNAKYYNNGVWMKFNDTDPGYELGVRNQSTGEMPYYRFAAEKAGDYISTVDVVLTKDITYSFLVRNDKAYYFTPNAATTCTSSNSHFELFKWDNSIEVVIKPTITGPYTFQLNLANGKVEIDVLYPTTSYRLVYVEKNGSTIEKFHPSHIIKNHPEATAEAPMFDTVSMHVRLKLLNKKAVTGTTDVSYDTVANTNTCEVWLQEFKEVGTTMDWVTIQNINTKDHLTTNGVYNFIITQADGSATIEPTAIRPYTGRYYIRTDASDGGWNNYKQLSNYCYYTEYSRVYRGFDHYYCHWTEAGNNTKYTIACDYSYCVSDTLAQEDHTPHSTFTDANGKLNNKANIRFMWHSFSNELDRAYIAGAGDNLYLLSEAGIYNMDGSKNTSAKLSDQQNWVYRVDVKADTQARIKLRAVPYNNANTYSWFRGLDGDFSDENTEQLIEGKAGTQYTIRVIYDFKTDHLICAWIPDKDTITSDDVINADLMIIRTDQGEAAQLNFKPNETKVTNITVAYCVLNLTNAHLSSSTKTSKEKGCYWVSFPYDVNLSDVFGCGKYGEDFIIQYYDGAERAEKGCWADSPTYWKYITNPTGVVLKKGLGYVLVIDYEKILREQFKHENSSVNIYFPSSGPIDAIDGVLPTAVEVPEHKCTITRNDRYIYDSNWNIIGIPTWANIDKFGNPMVAEQSTSNLSQGGTVTYTIGFYYAHDAVNNKWTVCETSKVDFLSMYSYLVQWAGTINWQEKSASGEHHPTLAPRRYAPAAEGEEEAEGAEASEQYTLRLTLHRGEQQLDHTYVRLQEGNVTTDFDLNYDMTKILNGGANLYSLVGTNLIQCAANVQPLQEEAQTISIPLGVVADQDGLYTFSLPDGTEGMNVSLVDNESGIVHNLALGDYQTALTKGTYEQRFALEIQPRQEVSTGCEQTDAAGKRLRKVLIDGNLYILRDGKAYTAAGVSL